MKEIHRIESQKSELMAKEATLMKLEKDVKIKNEALKNAEATAKTNQNTLQQLKNVSQFFVGDSRIKLNKPDPKGYEKDTNYSSAKKAVSVHNEIIKTAKENIGVLKQEINTSENEIAQPSRTLAKFDEVVLKNEQEAINSYNKEIKESKPAEVIKPSVPLIPVVAPVVPRQLNLSNTINPLNNFNYNSRTVPNSFIPQTETLSWTQNGRKIQSFQKNGHTYSKIQCNPNTRMCTYTLVQ